MKLQKIIYWLPRVLAGILLLFWGGILVINETAGHWPALALLLLMIIVSVLIAWKSESIGGAILLIISSITLVILEMTRQLGTYLPGLSLLFMTGVCFIITHLYLEKKEQEEDEL